MQRYLLGIDIGGTKCAVILGRESSDGIEVVDKTRFMTAEQGGPYQCIEQFVADTKSILKRHQIELSKVAGIGISCGGPLDSRSGVILSPPNLPGWDQIPIVEHISREFELPVYLQNDANACAVAEWKYGAGKGSSNMIFMTFGTGLGAGLILNGKLYAGSNDMAGECGHIRLESNGPVGYGKAGSFEGFCSGGGIAQVAKTRLLEVFQRGGSVSWCDGIGELEQVTAKTVADAANSGDELARGIYAETGRHLGRGLALLIDILNPERIVIGSVFARSENLLRPAMEAIIEQEALDHAREICEVVPAGLGESIGDIASLALAAGGY